MRNILAFFIFVVLFANVGAYHCSPGKDEFLIKVTLDENTIIEKTVILAGQYNGVFQLRTNVQGVSFPDQSITFIQGDESKIRIIFNSSALEPGVYVGRVTAQKDEDIISIPVIFEVETHELFFDLDTTIPPIYKVVQPGMQFSSDVSIFDLTSTKPENGLGPTSVEVDYRVYDFNGQILYEQTKQTIVQHTAHTTHAFIIPKSVDCHEYVFTAAVKYNETVRVASSLFTVSEPEPTLTRVQVYFLIALIFLFTLIVAIFFMMRYYHQPRKTQ